MVAVAAKRCMTSPPIARTCAARIKSEGPAGLIAPPAGPQTNGAAPGDGWAYACYCPADVERRTAPPGRLHFYKRDTLLQSPPAPSRHRHRTPSANSTACLDITSSLPARLPVRESVSQRAPLTR